MRAIHEAAEIIGQAVKVSGSEPQSPVVSPAETPWKLSHRHKLDARDADFGKCLDLCHRATPGTFQGESTHVHFVKNLTGDGDTRPCAVSPLESVPIDYFRRTVYAKGLKSRCWIGKTAAAIEPVLIAGSCSGSLDESLKVAGSQPRHGICLRFR